MDRIFVLDEVLLCGIKDLYILNEKKLMNSMMKGTLLAPNIHDWPQQLRKQCAEEKVHFLELGAMAAGVRGGGDYDTCLAFANL